MKYKYDIGDVVKVKQFADIVPDASVHDDDTISEHKYYGLRQYFGLDHKTIDQYASYGKFIIDMLTTWKGYPAYKLRCPNVNDTQPTSIKLFVWGEGMLYYADSETIEDDSSLMPADDNDFINFLMG